jgi:hypothetical protein
MHRDGPEKLDADCFAALRSIIDSIGSKEPAAAPGFAPTDRLADWPSSVDAELSIAR